MPRYQVMPGSQSCSSFFHYTVVDTYHVYTDADQFELIQTLYESVCECADEVSALMIAIALNASNK